MRIGLFTMGSTTPFECGADLVAGILEALLGAAYFVPPFCISQTRIAIAIVGLVSLLALTDVDCYAPGLHFIVGEALLGR